MKTPPPPFDSDWENLLRRARADVGPPADSPALLWAIRQISAAQPESWVADFSMFFSSGRVIPGCLAGASAFALLATWQAWDAWQTLPWAQLLDAATGGAS